MKIKINKELLVKKLTLLIAGIPSKAIIAVDDLFNFNINAETGSCIISICNSMVEMTTFIKVDAEEDCEFCLPSHISYNTIKNFPDGEIQIETVYNAGMVSAIKLKPEGQRKKYKIACYKDLHSFSLWPNESNEVVIDEFETNTGTLQEALKITKHNSSKNDLNAQFSNIVFYKYKGKLVVSSVNRNAFCFSFTEDTISDSSIVNYSTPDLISGLNPNEKCTIKITEQRAIFTQGSTIIKTILIHEKLSNYSSFLDKKPDNVIKINSADMMTSIQMLLPYNMNRYGKIICEGNTLTLKSTDLNNDAEEVLEIENEDNISFNQGINLSLLDRAFRAIKSDVVNMGFEDAFFFNSDENTQLWMFMPLKA